MSYPTSTIRIMASINRRNQQRQHTLIDNLFIDYSKLLTVRLDFHIKKDYLEANTYDYMNEAFTRLRNNLRSNSLFEHYITYSARLEYGTDRKWHFHVLFFFDGQQIKNDYLLARGIGQYWCSTITGGIGDYYSANMNTAKYQTFAMGMINYYDANKIADLKAAADYLIKETVLHSGVVMQDAAGKQYRSYRQSRYQVRDTALGRPRRWMS